MCDTLFVANVSPEYVTDTVVLDWLVIFSLIEAKDLTAFDISQISVCYSSYLLYSSICWLD